jgi:hypothetical protein
VKVNGRSLRLLLRALHRDAGYLAVGLTVVYAVSGLAVNHIKDWDPNFTEVRETLDVPLAGLVADPGQSAHNDQLARRILHALAWKEQPNSVYAPTAHELDITFKNADLHVDLAQKVAFHNGQRERFLLRSANFLHLNRGKKAWTYVADAYALLLLTLAVSGMFMIKGRQGLLGRGAVLVLLGASVPVGYILLSSL